MRISQVAAATGVPAKTIRFYESVGILPSAPRRPNSYREYGEDDLCRLRLVAALRALGLGLSESGNLAALCVDGQCDEMATQLRQRVADRRREIAGSQAELAHLDAELANLEVGLDANTPVRALCIGEGGDERAEV